MAGPGILGVVQSDPEVVAVYPQLSSTIIPYSQEIRIHRGDSMDIRVQVQNDGDPPDRVDLSNGTVRWAAKQGYGVVPTSSRVQVGNEGALILKRSYDPSEVEIEGGGRATIHLYPDDTERLPLIPAVWDLEVVRPTMPIEVGTDARAQVLANSPVVWLRNFDIAKSKLRKGDLIHVQGRTVLVTSILDAMQITVDFLGWKTASEPFRLSKGAKKTVASGRFVIDGDVVL